MSWNLMIAGVVLAVVLVNLVVFKVFSGKKNIFARSLKLICLLCFIPVAIAILLPNVFWILSPLTPAIHGKVIDAETGKGIPQVNILVAWRVSGVTVGGGSRQTYRNYRTTTDEKGEFRVPRTLKAFSVVILPIAYAEYGGMSILAYDFDHENVLSGAGNSAGETFVLTMNPIRTDSEYFANLKQIQKNIFYQVRESDEAFLKKELFQLVPAYRLFEKKYPQSTLHEEVFSKLSSIYSQTNSKREEIEFWQEYLQKYPSGKRAEYGRSELKWLRHWVNKEK